MTRRNFIHRLLQGAASASLMGFPGACASRPLATDGDADGTGLAYRPLNGTSMRDLARRKMHHRQGEFLNPFSDIPKGNLGRVLKWKWFTKNHFKPYYSDDVPTPVTVDRSAIADGAGLSITLLKHAGILIKDGDAFILIDPVFGGLFWFIEDFSPLAFDPATLPQPKHVLVTHGHYDHLDAASLATWGNGTHVICPLGYDDLFNDWGMTHRTRLDWYEHYYEDGREIIFLPCNHWTMRNPLVGPNTALWGSYLVRTKSGACVYISGDTGFFDGFDQIGEEFDIDLAIFNLGAYEPRWFMAPSHMNPEETVTAFLDLKARHLAIAHWGTFRLGDEPVNWPPVAIRQALRERQLEDRYIELKHGHTVSYS